MLRPELVEIKNTIKSLKKDAEMRLTLDMEAQQSFEFISDQVHGLRRAFSTLSDVLIEEVDLIRSEAVERNQDLQQRHTVQAKALKANKTDIALLRGEAQAARSALSGRAFALEERLDAMQEDLKVLAQEVAKGSSAQHLLQLEVVELRSQLEEEARGRRAAVEALEGRVAQLLERLDAHSQDARASMQALDEDISRVRTTSERQLGSHSAAIEHNKGKLLQTGQAIEKQWSATKALQQRAESLASSTSLQNQQLNERLETMSKQQARWKASIEEALKTLSADSQLLQAHCRSLESTVGTSRTDARRLISEHEAETQRQCDTLGRAIHSLADTLNLTSPLISMGSLSTNAQ
uniref:Uncharacterized protein n=1 Tax=Calcidiscus leptoporus TaxID=127549 RepID=A0A7S0JKQ0_9EUKA|mmetsp:Transcript_9206/g.21362  ORF Transcript_9206/g.21362 Transcript_9206/m.21362 type:complete len:351 (+) Transcript_9206:111-1163(+)